MQSIFQIRSFSQRIYTLFPFISKNKQISQNDSFLTMTSNQYLENLYQSWKKEPKSVDSSWHSYFKTMAQDQPRQYHDLPRTSQSSQKSFSNVAKEQGNLKSILF